MASDKHTVDYGTLLLDLEAKKAAIEALISYVKVAQTLGIPTLMEISHGAIATMSGSIGPDDIPAGAFRRKSVPEAIKAYLSMVKKKQTTREIIDALQKGGMESTSSKFDQIVYNGLRRMLKHTGEILRSGDAWGLAEWWPPSMRAVQLKSVRRKSKERRAPRMRTREITEPSTSPTPMIGTSSSGITRAKVLSLLRASGESGQTVDEIAKTLQADSKGVRLLLGRMASWHDARKIGEDKYRFNKRR
jgi:hypothetical protein